MVEGPAAPFIVTRQTRVSAILTRYGDIAEVMEVFGIKRVGSLSLRRFLARFLTVERAAKVHQVPLERFLKLLQVAIARVETRQAGR
jgi:hypothetical protein